MKKETLEEAAAKHFNKEVFVEGVTIQYALQEAFITGAKYQAERMYSEEDMKNCFHAGEMHCATEGKVYERSANFKEWFNQFKKK
jgi:hypothetical protein